MSKTICNKKECNKCGKIIGYTYKIDIGNCYKFISENTQDRYIDKWGYGRNYCKSCIR